MYSCLKGGTLIEIGDLIGCSCAILVCTFCDIPELYVSIATYLLSNIVYAHREHKVKSDRTMSLVWPGSGNVPTDRKQCRFGALLKSFALLAVWYVRAGKPRTSVKFRADKTTYSTLLKF
jgi:hypothetical protein